MSISITIIDSIFIVLFSFVQGYICHRSMAAENIHSKTHRELTEWYTMFPNNQWDILIVLQAKISIQINQV